MPSMHRIHMSVRGHNAKQKIRCSSLCVYGLVFQPRACHYSNDEIDSFRHLLLLNIQAIARIAADAKYIRHDRALHTAT